MPAMPHIPLVHSDAAHLLIRAQFQARQCRSNPFQALPVAPLLYVLEARLALTATQIFVFDQTPESACETINVPGRRRVTVDTVFPQVRNASRLPGDHDGK